mmetsp:Transcript_70434/g.152994  ORF Transcript_70434/g.152994 Transcript_70434/m.152994 type:complete len:227 (-) Transcript_70434:470-1150(-)
MDLCHVVTTRHVSDSDAAAALLQQPVDELTATIALLLCPGDEGSMAYILEDGSRGKLELLPCVTFLAESIAQLIISEDQPICVEASPVRDLLLDAAGEETRALRLHPAHHLELRSSPSALRAKDRQLLAASTATGLVFCLVHEEHERAPLLLHCPERCSTVPGDVTNAVAGDFHHSDIVPILPVIDIDRPLELREEPLHVLTSPLSLCLDAGEQCNTANVLHNCRR